MALARTKSVVPIAEPLADGVPLRAPWRGAVGRALPMVEPMVPPSRLRRCVHRRLTPHGGGPRSQASYTAECLYAGVDEPMALGDLSVARETCKGCTRTGLWRDDEE
ncbi:MAG: hypothetical protein KF809_11675 [Chloroflexi bacterium]|nr:hypothetical protein [Chloroflexota bacterium]